MIHWLIYTCVLCSLTPGIEKPLNTLLTTKSVTASVLAITRPSVTAFVVALKKLKCISRWSSIWYAYCSSCVGLSKVPWGSGTLFNALDHTHALHAPDESNWSQISRIIFERGANPCGALYRSRELQKSISNPLNRCCRWVWRQVSSARRRRIN